MITFAQFLWGVAWFLMIGVLCSALIYEGFRERVRTTFLLGAVCLVFGIVVLLFGLLFVKAVLNLVGW